MWASQSGHPLFVHNSRHGPSMQGNIVIIKETEKLWKALYPFHSIDCIFLYPMIYVSF